MKDRRKRESYLFSAAQHEKIVQALPRLSGAKLRALMRDSVADWKTEIFSAVSATRLRTSKVHLAPLLGYTAF